MATATWQLESGQKKKQQKTPRSFSHLFACFRPFSFFSLVFVLSGVSASDLVWPSVFVFLFTRFARCHLATAIDSPDNLSSILGKPDLYTLLAYTEFRLLLTHVDAPQSPGAYQRARPPSFPMPLPWTACLALRGGAVRRGGPPLKDKKPPLHPHVASAMKRHKDLTPGTLPEIRAS